MQESKKPDKRFWIMSFSGVYLCYVSYDGAPVPSFLEMTYHKRSDIMQFLCWGICQVMFAFKTG